MTKLILDNVQYTSLLANFTNFSSDMVSSYTVPGQVISSYGFSSTTYHSYMNTTPPIGNVNFVMSQVRVDNVGLGLPTFVLSGFHQISIPITGGNLLVSQYLLYGDNGTMLYMITDMFNSSPNSYTTPTFVVNWTADFSLSPV